MTAPNTELCCFLKLQPLKLTPKLDSIASRFGLNNAPFFILGFTFWTHELKVIHGGADIEHIIIVLLKHNASQSSTTVFLQAKFEKII